MAVEVVRDKKLPTTKCPGCLKPMTIDIGPFKNDLSRIVKCPCPNCKRTLWTGILVATQTSIQGLAQVIDAMVAASGTPPKQVTR